MEEVITHTDSKAVVKGFAISTIQTVFPNFNFDQVLALCDNDPIVRGALSHFVDKCMEGDYSIVYVDPESKEFTYDKSFEMLLDRKYNFRTAILRKTFLSAKLFNNAFIEIVKDTQNETKSLNVVDPTIIEPITQPNGDPIRYEQRKNTASLSSSVSWSKEEIVWIKINDRSGGFAPVDIGALAKTLYAKKYVTDYVAWLFKTGQYRTVYNFKNSSEKDVEDFLVFYDKVNSDFTMPLIAKGEMVSSILRDMSEVDNLLNLLKYYDNQLLVNLRIPPMDAGLPDGSGRSNADASANNLSTHIISFKKSVEDYVNYELFPKINKSNNLLRFAPVDRFSEEQVFKIAQMMQAMNMKQDVIAEYLFDKGLIFNTDELFNDEPVDVSSNPRSKDMAPSRVDQSGQDTRGVGGVSDVSTREDQL